MLGNAVLLVVGLTFGHDFRPVAIHDGQRLQMAVAVQVAALARQLLGGAKALGGSCTGRPESGEAQESEAEQIVEALARRYPLRLIADQLADVPRIRFHVALVRSVVPDPSRARLCDLGGGIGLFAPACAEGGFKRVVLVDDFADPINRDVGEAALAVHKDLGVEVIRRDVILQGLEGVAGPFDVVTAFETMEHWHHSPKRLFHQALDLLASGGAVIIGVPNCVDLFKRALSVLGLASWSQMRDWYEPPVFRGHVREASVRDLRYIARDLALTDVRILGANWTLRRRIGWLPDHLLRWRPSVCSDIYMVGRKP